MASVDAHFSPTRKFCVNLGNILGKTLYKSLKTYKIRLSCKQVSANHESINTLETIWIYRYSCDIRSQLSKNILCMSLI